MKTRLDLSLYTQREKGVGRYGRYQISRLNGYGQASNSTTSTYEYLDKASVWSFATSRFSWFYRGLG
jgi:hypothetical protein